MPMLGTNNWFCKQQKYKQTEKSEVKRLLWLLYVREEYFPTVAVLIFNTPVLAVS